MSGIKSSKFKCSIPGKPIYLKYQVKEGIKYV